MSLVTDPTLIPSAYKLCTSFLLPIISSTYEKVLLSDETHIYFAGVLTDDANSHINAKKACAATVAQIPNNVPMIGQLMTVRHDYYMVTLQGNFKSNWTIVHLGLHWNGSAPAWFDTTSTFDPYKFFDCGQSGPGPSALFSHTMDDVNNSGVISVSFSYMTDCGAYPDDKTWMIPDYGWPNANHSYYLCEIPVSSCIPKFALADSIVATAGYSVYFPSSLVGMIFLMASQAMRYDVKWIKRNPLLVTIEMTSFTLSVLFFSLFYIAHGRVRAGAAVSMYFFFGFIGLATVFFRLCHLQIEFQKVKLLLRMHGGHKIGQQSAGQLAASPWIKLRHFFESWRAIIIILIFSLIAIIVTQVEMQGCPKNEMNDVDALRDCYSRGSKPAAFFWIVMTATSCVFGFNLGYEGKESLGIKRELELKVVGGILVILSSLLSNNPRFYVGAEIRFMLIWLALCWEASVTIWLLIWKIRKEKKKQRQSDNFQQLQERPSDVSEINSPSGMRESKDATFSQIAGVSGGHDLRVSDMRVSSPIQTNITLKAVLEDPKLSELFEEFLCSEFSVEHMLFVKAVSEFEDKWKKVDKFKDVNHWKKYVSDCVKIQSEFCDEKCLAPINISYGLRASITEEVKKIEGALVTTTEEAAAKAVDWHVFGKCDEEVRKLLSFDSLNRFKRSAPFEEYRTSAALRLSSPTALPM
eukprot:TRINITY_DN17496_c0_g1_i1.p1 TRINITY_DN17496_c0_g1~~TRINITY_DN17496_c0_g1_i1.p1  ORF type:complete len:703 (-),score=150.73 TRINITY_DN17496_c0_g1_i1:33-2114(-)